MSAELDEFSVSCAIFIGSTEIVLSALICIIRDDDFQQYLMDDSFTVFHADNLFRKRQIARSIVGREKCVCGGQREPNVMVKLDLFAFAVPILFAKNFWVNAVNVVICSSLVYGLVKVKVTHTRNFCAHSAQHTFTNCSTESNVIVLLWPLCGLNFHVLAQALAAPAVAAQGGAAGVSVLHHVATYIRFYSLYDNGHDIPPDRHKRLRWIVSVLHNYHLYASSVNCRW